MGTKIDVDEVSSWLKAKGWGEAAMALEGGIEMAGDACRILGFEQKPGNALATTTTTPPASTSCGCDKKPEAAMANHGIPAVYGDVWAQLVASLQMRGCGVACRPMSACMKWALQMMLTRVSLRRLWAMLEKDDDSTEINTFCGGSDFVNITTTPLANNKTTLLTMSPQQLLPLIPAISKAAVTWSGDPVDSGVTLQLYQGPKGLTGLQLADLANGALQVVGSSKNLTRWFCKDQCFIRPWPPFLGCSGGVIPDTEAIYLQITTDGTLGASTLKALPFEILKAGTYDANRWCGSCGVTTDNFGTPITVPGNWL